MNNKIKIFGILAISATMLFQGCADKLYVPNPNSLNDDQVRQLLASSDEGKVEETLKAIGYTGGVSCEPGKGGWGDPKALAKNLETTLKTLKSLV